MSKSQRLTRAVLRTPLLWGTLASFVFYAAVQSGLLGGSFIHRYFASHLVEYIATTMFFVGVAALLIKTFDVLAELTAVGRSVFGPAQAGAHRAADCSALLEQISQAPGPLQDGYLLRRVKEALQYIQRKAATDTLDDQLRYLAEVDRDRQHESYSLVRIILWAIPILGFLGTVIGITMAIGNLSPEQLTTSLKEVVGGLQVAFDTTALALGLTIPLMFLKFYVEKFENRLLEAVDDRAAAELDGRFDATGGGDPQVASIRRIGETVVQATEQLVHQQATLWRETIDAAHQQWSTLAGETGQQVRESLDESLTKSLKAHAGQLAAAERAASEQNRQHWDRVSQSMAASTEAMAAQQSELVRQGETMLKVVDATGQVVRLEDTLNRNLAELAGARNFEEMITSLAAAIQLLSAKLGRPEPAAADVSLASTEDESGQAA